MQTEAYGTVLAKEVAEEARKKEIPIQRTLEERKEALKKQIKDSDDRQTVIDIMTRHTHPH